MFVVNGVKLLLKARDFYLNILDLYSVGRGIVRSPGESLQSEYYESDESAYRRWENDIE